MPEQTSEFVGWYFERDKWVVWIFEADRDKAELIATKHLGGSPTSTAQPLPRAVQDFFKVGPGAIITGSIISSGTM